MYRILQIRRSSRYSWRVRTSLPVLVPTRQLRPTFFAAPAHPQPNRRCTTHTPKKSSKLAFFSFFVPLSPSLSTNALERERGRGLRGSGSLFAAPYPFRRFDSINAVRRATTASCNHVPLPLPLLPLFPETLVP